MIGNCSRYVRLVMTRWRDRDVDIGDGGKDPATARRWQVDQGDRAGPAVVAQAGEEGDQGTGCGLRVSALGATASPDRSLPGALGCSVGRERGAAPARSAADDA